MLKRTSKHILLCVLALICAIDFVLIVALSVSPDNYGLQMTSSRLNYVEIKHIEYNDEIAGLLAELQNIYIVKARQLADIVADAPDKIYDCDYLGGIAEMLDASEVHIFDQRGRVIASNIAEYIDFDLKVSRPDSKSLLVLDYPDMEIAQPPVANALGGDLVIYCTVARKDGNEGGIVQIGITPTYVLSLSNMQKLEYIVENSTVGENGFFVITDTATSRITYHPDVRKIGSSFNESNRESGALSHDGKMYYFTLEQIDDQTVYALIPFTEATHKTIGMIIFYSAVVFGFCALLVFSYIRFVQRKVAAPSEDITKEVKRFIGLNKTFYDQNYYKMNLVNDGRILPELSEVMDNFTFVGSDIYYEHISTNLLMKELEEATLEAVNSDSLKSYFVANVSHEIRTPMNTILGYTELAKQDGFPENINKYFNDINISARALLGVLNDIRDISEAEQNTLKLEIAPFRIHDILEMCQAISLHRASEKNIEVFFYAEPEVDRLLRGDSVKLGQVLLNLINNSLKFTEKGNVKIAINVLNESYRDVELEFIVKDTGIGMSEEQLERITEPFVQADSSTTRRYGGTGLGLAISKKIIELMGGSLLIESELGVGTKFSFALTFEKEEHSSAIGDEKIQPIEMSKPMFEGVALVFEDNLMNQQVMREHLIRIGFTPIIAENGKVGVDIARKFMEDERKISVVLMDLYMPLMDGYEATKELLDMGIDVPIIAVTANTLFDSKKSCIEHGMTDFIGKPFAPSELWECLMRNLQPIEMVDPSFKTDIKFVTSENKISLMDREAGLKNALGDEQFYENLRRDFFNDHRHTYHEICAAVQNDDLRLAHRLAHSLKSTAAMIGATTLKDCAHGAELILKQIIEGENVEMFYLVAEKLERNLDGLLGELAEEFGDLTAEVETQKYDDTCELPTDISAVDIPPELTVENLDKLIRALSQGNIAVVDYIEAIAQMVNVFAGAGTLLVKQIDNYDFEEAQITAEKLRAELIRIKGGGVDE